MDIPPNKITRNRSHNEGSRSKLPLAFTKQYFAAFKPNSPGIVLVHNWMGVSPETEKQALRFQKLGYNVLVADIYGASARPTNPKEAGALAAKYKTDRKLLRERSSQ